MMLVTAAIVPEGPIRSSHSSAARSIGSNGSGSRDTMTTDASSLTCPHAPRRTASDVHDGEWSTTSVVRADDHAGSPGGGVVVQAVAHARGIQRGPDRWRIGERGRGGRRGGAGGPG